MPQQIQLELNSILNNKLVITNYIFIILLVLPIVIVILIVNIIGITISITCKQCKY